MVRGSHFGGSPLTDSPSDNEEDGYEGSESEIEGNGPSTAGSSHFEYTDEPQSPGHVSRPRMYVMVIGEAGLIFSWVLRFAFTTPYFQHALNSGVFLSHAVWILGPLSGLIVAPIVGVLSDRCTSPFGRRRPFIFVGLVTSLFSMNIFANAKEITSLLGVQHLSWAPILLALVSYAVIDLSANAIMFPSRALMGDLVPKEQQHEVQSSAAVIASLTEILGSLYVYALDEPVSHIKDAFFVATLVMALSVSITLLICREKPMIAPERTDDAAGDAILSSKMTELEHMELQDAEVNDGDAGLNDDHDSPSKSESEFGLQQYNISSHDPSERGIFTSVVQLLGTALSTFPRELNFVGVVYGLAWFCWYASLPYFSAWIGSDVLGGDPDAPKGSVEAQSYQLGVNIFGVANGIKAFLALAFGAIYPSLIRRIGVYGERLVFALTFMIFCPFLFFVSSTKSVYLAGATVSLSSFAFIATQTIPIAIVVQRFSENVASNLGILNLYCVLPQLIDTLYTGILAKVAGETLVLKIAAAWGIGAAIAGYCLL